MLHLSEIGRYPVKSLAGERLQAATIGADGLAGDRLVQVRDGRGRIVTARTHPRLLGLRGGRDGDGEPTVDGHPWRSAVALEAVRSAAGPAAWLGHDDSPDRFDVLPLLVATDGAIRALGADGRRLRPNLVIGGVDGLAERDWPGRRLRIGEVVVEIASLRQRCVMTTFDPDTQAQDHGVLRRIAKEFGGRLALDAAVVEGGRVAVGDPVTVL
jgi:uncharacterized protein YcbX